MLVLLGLLKLGALIRHICMRITVEVSGGIAVILLA